MRTNRVISALQRLGGTGTTQDITRLVRGRPECVSAQLAGMARRGSVRRVGERVVRARRWRRQSVAVVATVWGLA